MIIRRCDTCEQPTDQDRRQWAESEDGCVTIRTEYTCTECGTIETNTEKYLNKDE